MFACTLVAFLTLAAAQNAPNPVPVRVDGALRLEDLPAVDPQVVESLRRYQNMRGATFVGFVPDQGGILVRTRFGDVDQIHLVKAPGGARTQLTFGAEPIGAVRPHPTDPHRISFGRDRGGNEDSQNWLLHTGTGQEHMWTDGKSRHGAPLWSWDGTRVVWSQNARNGRDEDLWTADADGRNAKLWLELEGSWSPTDLSRDGATVLLSHYLSSTRSELWAFRSSTGEKQRLSPAGEVSVSGGALGPDGTWALAASDHESEFKQLYRVDLASGAWTSLTPGLTWGVDGFALAPDGKTAAVVVNERGWDRLHLLDLKSGRLRPVSGLPEGQIGTMGFDLANPRRLGLTAGGPQSPLDAWVLDTKTGAAVRWTTSETGGLDPSTFVRPETVTWTTFDGRTLDALAYRPSGTGPFPVVISIHGGPEGQSRPSMNPLAQVLVQRGFVYLEPNVRGSTGYGKSFLAADNGRLREDAVKDIGTLLDWISRQPDMDAKRVAVRGGSYGGYMVLASLIHHGERLRAGIDIVGISDFVTFLESTRAYRQDLRRVEYGDERDPDMRAFLQSISPMARANEIRSQLLVMHGANDPRVPVQEAEQIVAKVRANGYRVGYLRAENEGHGFRKKQNRDLAEALQVMFLEQALELPR